MNRRGNVCALALCLLSAAGPALPQIDEFAAEMDRSWQLHRKGEFATAAEIMRALISRIQSAPPTQRTPLALAITTLGLEYFELGRYADAESTFQRALHVVEETKGRQSPDYGFLLINLSAVNDAVGNGRRSESQIRHALEIYKATLEPDDLRFALAHSALAQRLAAKHQFADAEEEFQQARTALERKFGPRHDRLAIVINNLAAMRRLQGRQAESIRLFEEAVQMLEETVGADHPHLVRSLHNLATAYQTAGRNQEADATFRRALAMAERRLGSDHPQYATVLANYARFLCHTGHKAEGKAMAARSKALLAQHRRVNGYGMTVDARDVSAFR